MHRQSFFRGFRSAYAGWASFFRRDRNGRVQLGIAVAVIALSALLRLSPVEWSIVLGFIGLVLGLEMMNSAIEKLCDLVEPRRHPVIGAVKDICAGAVLWAACAATAAAAVIFLPKIIAWL